jgi:hypothetical protein
MVVLDTDSDILSLSFGLPRYEVFVQINIVQFLFNSQNAVQVHCDRCYRNL